MQPETAEAEVVETAELVPTEPEPITLWHTSDPEVALQRMSRIAKTLVEVVDDRRLYVRISGKKYLYVSAWQALAGMTGVFAIVVWTRLNESGDGYVARVEARTRAGEIVGAAEAECSRVEEKWAKRDPYMLRSMAQTRAISRALRGPLEQVVVLAGYEPTGAEEMPDEGEHDARMGVRSEPASVEQVEEISTLIRTLERIDHKEDWRAISRGIAGGFPGASLKRGPAEDVIGRLLERLAGYDEAAR